MQHKFPQASHLLSKIAGKFTMHIAIDDLRGAEIAAFLEEHLRDMRSVSPPESKHALDLEALRKPEITFWTMRIDERISGCCALKHLDAYHGEIKSMRTDASLRRSGVASTILQHVIRIATERGYHRLSLETGAMDFFAPARALYVKFGFELCRPFDAYRDDPNSVFFTRSLSALKDMNGMPTHLPGAAGVGQIK